ncbi:tetratricopeptide repeat-containing sensor histidine kinase [Tamlana sp. 2_MG-2023]|uniref:tetratricopeptide repeat-containing sensor histidine kinase n=1 Tax=unclassified Tamlana TaxID=2614803 RepID=UPI0026E3D4E6|nr:MULTISPECIES: tetratricopeptide repeat-containing sensor histidine kinase [unclassified Tamlana]MDO6760823.1 tetratricopeptide repeat-containing sensor histidine kinase [Tamlana sp. 2_MG-2023]MDO6791079.1 tetratricopeptide repeat-containing sensor histidine kinase [Tamlana sp. 1_MG-2023]
MRLLIFLIITLFSICTGHTQSNDIDSLALQLAFQNQDSLKINLSLKLIESLYENNEIDRAYKYVIESEKLSHHLNHKHGIANATYYKALLYAKKNDYINAISGYEKSKHLFKNLKDTLGIAKVNNSIGLIEIKRGNFSKGMPLSLSAIRELEKRHLKHELNLAYSNLANAYYSIGATDKAIEFYLKTLEVQEQINDQDAIYVTKNSLAELFSNRKEHRKAIEIYESITEFSDTLSDSIKGHIYPKLGAEYLEFNEYDKASKYLDEAYTINILKEDKSDLLVTLNNLGDLNLRQNTFWKAEPQLIEAGQIAEQTGNRQELLKQYKLMKSLDSTRRRFEKAFTWQRAYYELNAEINREKAEQKEKLLIPLEDFEQEPPEVLLTTTDSQQNVRMLSDVTEDTSSLKLSLYSLVAALILVSIFLILTFLKRQSTIKYTKELEDKNLSIALQNEAFSEQTKHLESVNNVKDKLFSIVSHDLRDSLSSINGFIDLLKDGTLTRDEFDNLIPELSENANNASLLLFNLLNWSKSQMQSLEPKPSLFDVQEVFASKVQLIEQRLESKGITLIDHSLKDFAYADRSMFEIVIQNLLANALKFCKNGDTITITNHINDGRSIVSIADSGIGISKENLNKLFKESSFSTLGTDNEKGTGLGLSICKELIDLNHGKIWVESTPNIGSTFYVQLPKSKPS